MSLWILITLSLTEVLLLFLLLMFYWRLKRSEQLVDLLQKRQEELVDRLHFNNELEQELVSSFATRQDELSALGQRIDSRAKELELLIEQADLIIKRPAPQAAPLHAPAPTPAPAPAAAVLEQDDDGPVEPSWVYDRKAAAPKPQRPAPSYEPTPAPTPQPTPRAEPASPRQQVINGFKRGLSVPQLVESTGLSVDEVELVLMDAKLK